MNDEILRLLSANNNQLIVGGDESTAYTYNKGKDSYFPTKKRGIFIRPMVDDDVMFSLPFFFRGAKSIHWENILLGGELLSIIQQTVQGFMSHDHPAAHPLDAVLLNVAVVPNARKTRLILAPESSGSMTAAPAFEPKFVQGTANKIQFSKGSLFGEMTLDLAVNQTALQMFSGLNEPEWSIPIQKSGPIQIVLNREPTPQTNIEELLSSIVTSRNHMKVFPKVREELVQTRVQQLMPPAQQAADFRGEVLPQGFEDFLIELALETLIQAEEATFTDDV